MTDSLILVAGADPAHWPIVRKALGGRWSTAFAVDLRGTLDVMAQERPGMLLVCSSLLDVGADECLARVREQDAELPVLVIGERSGEGAASPQVAYLPQRSVPSDLAGAVDKMLSRREDRAPAGLDEPRSRPSPLEPEAHRPMVLGTSAAMRKVADTIRRIARVNVTVLLFGETGCGKELFARRIHCMSERAGGPFRAVSLPAVPKDLFESVLFGHERGAFTGAISQSPGAFGQANGGTLFLDEVSSLRLEVQPKLLRAIQEREAERVGAREPTPCDARIVAATNVDLRAAAERREFREDLYHRLSVVTIEIPPLRQRPEDIPHLVRFFLDRYSQEFQVDKPEVGTEAMEALMRYEWSGNVRELENRVQRALLLAPDRALQPEDFLDQGSVASAPGLHFGRYRYSLAEVEQAYIEQVVAHTGGNQSRAAQILEIDRKTLRSKLQRRGISLHSGGAMLSNGARIDAV